MDLNKRFVVLILAICCFQLAFGQFDNSLKGVPVKDRLMFGGNVAAQFGTYTWLELSPSVGYLVTEKYMTGIGLSFIYSKYNDPNFPTYESKRYGIRNFHRFYITESLFAWGEIEWLNFEYQEPFFPYELDRIWYTSYFVGGGYMSRFPNGKGGMYVSFLYNLNHGPESPYSSAIVPRIGIFF